MFHLTDTPKSHRRASRRSALVAAPGVLLLALGFAGCGGTSRTPATTAATTTATTVASAPTATAVTAPVARKRHPSARPAPKPKATPKTAPTVTAAAEHAQSTTTTTEATTTTSPTTTTTTRPTTTTTATTATATTKTSTTPPASAAAAKPVLVGPIHATLVGDNHAPIVNMAWTYTVTVTDANGRPLSGTLDVEFALGGNVVGHDRPPTRPLTDGHAHQTMKFPSIAVGVPLELQVVVHTTVGTTTLDWAVTVKR
jgi:outer membrane biosynthesis protein TonB